MTFSVGETELHLGKFWRFIKATDGGMEDVQQQARHQEHMVFSPAKVLEAKWKTLIKTYMAVQ